jgi:hypothetical protein
MAWAVVPLPEVPPRVGADLEAWARSVGLEAAGFVLRATGSTATATLGSREIALIFGDSAFPDELLDDMLLPEEYRPGVSFVGLSPCMPSMLGTAIAAGQRPDLWGEVGLVRVATRAAACLARYAGSIVLPQARAAMPADRFVDFAAGHDQLEARPMAAWLWWSVDDDWGVYRSYGMALVGLPDVEVSVDVTDFADLDRAAHAVLWACSTMVWREQELEVGSNFDVPVDGVLGPALPGPARGECIRYRVERRTLTAHDEAVFCRHGRIQDAGWLVLKAEDHIVVDE